MQGAYWRHAIVASADCRCPKVEKMEWNWGEWRRTIAVSGKDLDSLAVVCWYRNPQSGEVCCLEVSSLIQF
jgi:hypothetical protein